jgi:hypothetical protein
VAKNSFHGTTDVYLNWPRYRNKVSDQLKCHKGYFVILNVLTNVTIKDEDCYHLDGTLCNVVEISGLSGDPAVSKIRVGRMKFVKSDNGSSRIP